MNQNHQHKLDHHHVGRNYKHLPRGSNEYPHCPALRLTTKTSFPKSHDKQVTFNATPFMMVDTKSVHCWGITHQTIHHPGQSGTKEVIDTKDMAKTGSVTTLEVDAAQVTTATMVTSYTGFSEGRIEPEVCCLKYLRKLIMIWKHGPPRYVKATLRNQRKTPEEQLSNARSQLWKCLICNNHQPIHPWSMTKNCDGRKDKKAPPWQPQWSLIPWTF